VAKNGLSFHSSVFYKATLEDSQLSAEGQFNPNPVKKKSLLILDAPEHVDSGNIKFKIGRRSSVYQLFSKRDFYFIICG
jgi:hypothetical protein